MGLDGVFNAAHRLDTAIKEQLNAPGASKGDIENRDMIGKTGDDLVARWNEEHPDDPIE